MGEYIVQYSHILNCTAVFDIKIQWVAVLEFKGLIYLDKERIEKLLLLK